jgi:hypothetical protein
MALAREWSIRAVPVEYYETLTENVFTATSQTVGRSFGGGKGLGQGHRISISGLFRHVTGQGPSFPIQPGLGCQSSFSQDLPAGRVAGFPGFELPPFCFSGVLSGELKAVFPPVWSLMTCPQ